MVSIEIDLIESNKSKWDKVELSTWQRGPLENRGENWIEMIENWLNLPNSKCVSRKEPREWEKDRGGEWSMYGWNFSMFYQQKPAMGRQKTNRRKLHIFSTYPHFIVYLKDYRTKMHEAAAAWAVTPCWNKIESSNVESAQLASHLTWFFLQKGFLCVSFVRFSRRGMDAV